MSEYLDRLQDDYRLAVEAGQSVMKTATDDKRTLTPEEDEQVDKAMADATRLKADIDKVSKFDAMRSTADAFRETAMPIIERSGAKGETEAQTLFRLISAGRGSFESTRNIPMGYEARALQSAGGSAIETSFADFVTVYERTLNPMLQISTVLSTRDGSPIVLPRLTADVATSGTVTAEAAGITEVDPTISSVTLVAWKRAVTTLWSAELDQDNIIGLDQLVANSIARHVGLAWGTAFTTGNDSSEANGFLTAAGTVTQGTALGTAAGVATDTFFAAADLVDLYYGLAAPYRANASWVVANTALAKMRKFRDSTGQFLWSPALQAGQPESFLNRPVYENPAMAAVASASRSVAVGDFSKYIIRDVVPVRIKISDEYKFSTDQVAIRYITRRDGDLPDTLAIRSLASAST